MHTFKTLTFVLQTEDELSVLLPNTQLMLVWDDQFIQFTVPLTQFMDQQGYFPSLLDHHRLFYSLLVYL